MPIATYKLYKCPKCEYKKTIFQGDIITSFPVCSKCKEMMELEANDTKNDLVVFLKSLFNKQKI